MDHHTQPRTSPLSPSPPASVQHSVQILQVPSSNIAVLTLTHVLVVRLSFPVARYLSPTPRKGANYIVGVPPVSGSRTRQIEGPPAVPRSVGSRRPRIYRSRNSGGARRSSYPATGYHHWEGSSFARLAGGGGLSFARLARVWRPFSPTCLGWGPFFRKTLPGSGGLSFASLAWGIGAVPSSPVPRANGGPAWPLYRG